MFKKIIVSIVNMFWNIIYPEWSPEEVNKFFDRFQNVLELSNYLVSNGYVWKTDGLNACYALDTFERPGQVLARKFANCSGYMRLFSEYVRYKRCADQIEEIFMHNGLLDDWHFILKITDEDAHYIQSNMYVTNETPSVWIAYKEKYKDIEIIDTWRK